MQVHTCVIPVGRWGMDIVVTAVVGKEWNEDDTDWGVVAGIGARLIEESLKYTNI